MDQNINDFNINKASRKDINQLYDKTVLVRVDFNIPTLNGTVTDDSRIRVSLPTLKKLINNNCKIILISHFGRPQGFFQEEASLKQLVPVIEKILEKKIYFSSLEEAEECLKTIRPGEILLLENLRFYKAEEQNEPEFAKALASLAEAFVNEAFSCSHRAHASIIEIPKFLPTFLGFNFLKEIEILATVKGEGAVAIIGGSKISTKLPLIASLIKKVENIIVGGAIINNILKQQGYNIGRSLYEALLEKEDRELASMLEGKEEIKLFIPFDVITAESRQSLDFHIVDIRDIPSNDMILDIGPASVMKIKKILDRAKTILWNGPLGAFEFPPFDNGSMAIAKHIAFLTKNCGITSIIGGGDSLAMIKKLTEGSSLNNVEKGQKILESSLEKLEESMNFSYVSTAGGAFLKFLESGLLPGII